MCRGRYRHEELLLALVWVWQDGVWDGSVLNARLSCNHEMRVKAALLQVVLNKHAILKTNAMNIQHLYNIYTQRKKKEKKSKVKQKKDSYTKAHNHHIPRQWT